MVLVMVLIMVPVMVRFWSVLPERRPVHLLEEPEDGAELGGGAVRALYVCIESALCIESACHVISRAHQPCIESPRVF